MLMSHQEPGTSMLSGWCVAQCQEADEYLVSIPKLTPSMHPKGDW